MATLFVHTAVIEAHGEDDGVDETLSDWIGRKLTEAAQEGLIVTSIELQFEKGRWEEFVKSVNE